MPEFLKLDEIALVVTTAATGCPLPIGFPIVTISGTTPVKFVIVLQSTPLIQISYNRIFLQNTNPFLEF